MDQKKKLTKSAIDALQPSAKEQRIWCAELPGFGVRVQPGGSKTYILRYRTKAGAPRKQVLAKACAMPPEKARQLAREVLAQVAAGADPLAERRAAAPRPADTQRTVEKLFQAYVAWMRTKGRSSASEVERALLLAANNAADGLGRQRPCGEVKPAEVVAYIAGIFQAGSRGAADKHRGYIASAYAWGIRSANDYTVAERQDWGITLNPAADLAKDSGATKARDRALSAPELHRLWRDTAPNAPGFDLGTAACIRLLLACGQRVQETLRLEGRELDLQARLWRMPAEKTKGGKKPHVVPLPECVLADLQLLRDVRGDGLLFPGRDGGVMDHRSVMQAIERWYKREGVPALQTRDLRRTWKSRAHDAGVDRFTRDLIQQHAKNDTGSKHYDHAQYLPQMIEAMEKWSAWLGKVTSPTPAAVITIAA